MREIDLLIIDGHANVRALLARRLNAHPRFRVVAHTGNPILGTEFAWLWEPDIILIDPKGPGLYGSETYRRIARASPSSRLVVFTSYLLEGERRTFLKAGFSNCLLKGMGLKALAEVLCSLRPPALV